MRTPALILGGWGLWLVTLTLVLALWSDDDLAIGLFAGAAGAILLLALFARLRPAMPPEERAVPGSGLPVAFLAGGITLAANGLYAGLWLILIGAELALFALALLAREALVNWRIRGAARRADLARPGGGR